MSGGVARALIAIRGGAVAGEVSFAVVEADAACEAVAAAECLWSLLAAGFPVPAVADVTGASREAARTACPDRTAKAGKE